MPTTTNYGWTTPADTDLVKDGAAAIRTLGSSIDTTVFNNANAAIAKTIVDAKGDIIAATAADTVSRLAVGANDTVLTADSSTATGLKWATPSSGSMTLLSTTSVSGSATITLSSINQTYNDLRVIIFGLTSSTANSIYRFLFNNSSTLHYQTGTNSGALYSVADDVLRMTTNNATRTNSSNVWCIDIFDYAATTRRKTFIMNGMATQASEGLQFYSYGGAFDSTSAITSLVLTNNNLDVFNGGTMLLYGVK